MIDGETFQVFVRLWPEIIKAAAISPLGIIALITLCVSSVIILIFGGKSSGIIRLLAFVAMLISFSFFVWIVTEQAKSMADQERQRNTLTGVLGRRDVACTGGLEIKDRRIVDAPAGRYFSNFSFDPVIPTTSHTGEEAGCIFLNRVRQPQSARVIQVDIMARADCGWSQGRTISVECRYTGHTEPLE